MAISTLITLSDANAAWGTIRYGGYTFTGLRDFKLKREEVYDDANRTIIYSRFTLTVHSHIPGSSLTGANSNLETLRRQLSEPALELLIMDTGLGDIRVNPTHTGSTITTQNNAAGQALTSYAFDYEWGPKPISCEFIQHGQVTTEMVWVCTFSARETTTSMPGIVAFNYKQDWSYDEAGLATRTITGYIQIPRTVNDIRPNSVGGKVNGVQTIPTADVYRRRLKCATPDQMQRTTRNFTLSADRLRLDFTIVDRQMESIVSSGFDAHPPGSVRAEFDYEIENAEPMNFASFKATISGTIELPPNTDPVKAAYMFMNIYFDRYQKLAAVKGVQVVIPIRLRWGRTLSTRKCYFTAEWLIVGCMNDLMENGGVYKPLDQSNYTQWRAFLESQNLWDNAGQNLLVYNQDEDVIYNMGASASALPFVNFGNDVSSTLDIGAPVPLEITATIFTGWLKFENRFEPVRTYNEPYHYASQVANYVTGTAQALSPIFPQMVGIPRINVQMRAAPTELIRMKGRGVWIGDKDHKPPIPNPITFAGKEIRMTRIKTSGPTAVYCMFGKTIYTFSWNVEYRIIGGYIYDIPTLPNPTLCCADTPAKV